MSIQYLIVNQSIVYIRQTFKTIPYCEGGGTPHLPLLSSLLGFIVPVLLLVILTVLIFFALLLSSHSLNPVKFLSHYYQTCFILFQVYI